MEDPEESLPVATERGPEREDIERVATIICSKDSGWSIGQASEYQGLNWRPDLSRADPASALHIHLTNRLRPYLLDRLSAAHAAGQEIHIALPLSALYAEPFLFAVHSLDPVIHLITGDGVSDPTRLLTLLCDQGVRVSPGARTTLGAHAVELSQAEGTSHVRGRRYEAAIAFLLSQVSDFEVVERNLRTDTEELDAVVQQRATEGRVWSGLGAPLILVEAKNWKVPVNQKEASAFRVKIDGRRGGVRLGLMFGASGFTSDALDQELRFASDDVTIAFVTPDQLHEWISSPDGDAYLETLVRRAILR